MQFRGITLPARLPGHVVTVVFALTLSAAWSCDFRGDSSADSTSVRDEGGVASAVDDAPTPTGSTQRVRSGPLARLNALIGDWRGIGQPRRGSSAGAWKETATAAWSFAGSQPSIVVTSADGRQFDRLEFRTEDDPRTLVIVQHLADEQQRIYHAPLDESWPGKVVGETEAVEAEPQFRLTMERRDDNRTLLLLERRTSPVASYRRVAGIGYQRTGTRLAVSGGNQRECVVTGGLGTIAVQHDGKTWYVCCTGCRQAFEADPEGIIAEYRAGLTEGSSAAP